MAKTKKEDGAERHTPESLGIAVNQLVQLMADLNSAKGTMEASGLKSLMIPQDASRVTGLKRLRSWVDSVRDAVNEDADKALRGAVNDVSDSQAKPRKNQQKK